MPFSVTREEYLSNLNQIAHGHKPSALLELYRLSRTDGQRTDIKKALGLGFGLAASKGYVLELALAYADPSLPASFREKIGPGILRAFFYYCRRARKPDYIPALLLLFRRLPPQFLHGAKMEIVRTGRLYAPLLKGPDFEALSREPEAALKLQKIELASLQHRLSVYSEPACRYLQEHADEKTAAEGIRTHRTSALAAIRFALSRQTLKAGIWARRRQVRKNRSPWDLGRSLAPAPVLPVKQAG